LLAGSAARHRADVRALYATAREVGRIRHVEASWVRSSGVPAAGGWFTHRRLSGGGALVDLGWHLFDVVTPLLGEFAFEQVVGVTHGDFLAAGDAAAAWRGDDAPAGGPAGDVEDTARGFLVTRDAVSVAVRVGWASHEPLDVTTVRVEGTAGTAHLRCTFGFSPNREGGSALTLTRRGTPETVPVPEEPIGAEYDRQLDAIAAALADPASRGRAAAEAARIIGVIERLYDSARPVPADLSSLREPSHGH
ncbi:MAG TPA: Gfo/Idh/MocA family oxidoreductase, partial [Thermomonospora sp.]|nr:Gfo/Idh/MocA family oxidoreductase [Thermomonospora sp.]